MLLFVPKARLELLNEMSIALRVCSELLRKDLQGGELGVKSLELGLALLLQLLLRLLRLLGNWRGGSR